MKIRQAGATYFQESLGAHASSVHVVSRYGVHARCVRSQAPAANGSVSYFHRRHEDTKNGGWSFAAAALISVIGSALAFYDQQFAFRAAAVVGLASGAFAVTGLVSGCVIMVRETQVAVQNLEEESELARARYHSRGQSPMP